ncbi:MAG: YggS family pyridoxal phosphate-dependent enzyme [Propionibacteriaceae bacterium]|nr:YggS family pyridoxal phosphate-dependent enzyme [Propionibacteriaceae bacterium]
MTGGGVAERLRQVEARIEAACARAGRPGGSVRLLPVTKTFPAASVLQAVEAGYRRFGENRVQELVAKAGQLAAVAGLEWEVIGHLQTNKAKAAAAVSVAVQSLDSLKLAVALDHACAALDKTLDVLVEVNSSGEPSKFGLPPDAVPAFARALRACARLRPLGLMTLALPSADPERVAECFRVMRRAQARLQDQDGGGWTELSMGMSGDYELAVEHGSTCVRVGTAIFGQR